MKLFDRVRRKKKITNNRKVGNAPSKSATNKVQLNLWVLEPIKTMSHILAVRYDVPIGALCGHCLEVGMAYLVIACEDSREEERVKQHLIDRHILGKSDGTSPLDHAIVSSPALAHLLRQDVDELDEAIKTLDNLYFAYDDLSDREWKVELVKARLDIKHRMLKLQIKLREMSTAYSSSEAETGEDADLEDDFMEEDLFE